MVIRFFLILLITVSQSAVFSQSDTSKKANPEIALYDSGKKLLDSAKYKEAIVLFKKAIKIKSDYTQAYNKMALAKLKEGDFKGSEKDLKTALKYSPDDFESEKTLGILYFETKRYSEAKVIIDSAIGQNPDDAELFHYRAKLMFEGKSYKTALDACSQALELNPKLTEIIYLKAQIRYKMKDYKYAINELNDYIKLLPADKPNYEAYKMRAKARFEVGDFKNAITDWNVYIDAFPKEEEALISRGACKIETNDNTGAILDFEESIKLNPKNPVSYNYRGVAKGENKQFVEALKDFDLAIKLKFDYGAAFVNRAAVKFASKDKRGACEDLNKADSLGDDMAIRLIETYANIKLFKMKTAIYRKANFNAAHRLHNPLFDDKKNKELFGLCNNPNYHGHNYDLIVKLTGEVDKETGYVFDMKLLNDLINIEIIERFDHKNLNLDTVEFKNINPTAENIACIIYELLRKKIDLVFDLEITLYETPRNYVVYPAK